MSSVLAQLFVALAVSLAAGVTLGFTMGVHRRSQGDDATPPSLASADTTLADAVEREASLIEALARADADLHARARELAVANEEITCLLEQLHEARHPSA